MIFRGSSYAIWCSGKRKTKHKLQLCLQVNGGSGKSYYVEHELVPFLKKDTKNICVVVSLYGLETLSDISKAIYMELRMHTFSNKSEGITAGKVIAKNILKNVVGGFGINLDISDNDLQEIYKSVDLS